MHVSLQHAYAWFTYIPGNVGVSSMSQEKVYNGGVAILNGHTEWSSSILWGVYYHSVQTHFTSTTDTRILIRHLNTVVENIDGSGKILVINRTRLACSVAAYQVESTSYNISV